MCNHSNCQHDDPFAGLDDGDELFTQTRPTDDRDVELASVSLGIYTETCTKCRGTGRFTSWSGRSLGECFACDGKGKKTYRTSPQQRERGRASAHRAKARKVAETLSKAEQWGNDNPSEYQWMQAKAESFDFARSMCDALVKYGHLTDAQLAAVRKCMLRDEERQLQRERERAEREARAHSVDISPILTAFATAKGNGVRWPKLRLDTFVFSPAGDSSPNAGSVYVKEGETYLGKITASRFIRSRDCSDDQEQRILAVASDPAAAATVYGQRFGRCSVCGRTLTNEESINRAIGPICAERYGF